MGNPDLPRAVRVSTTLRFEHDACGVAFVVDMHGRKSHEHGPPGHHRAVQPDHRGASGSEANTGDGAGITHPDARPLPARESSTSSCPRPARTRPASRSCPSTRRRGQGRRRRSTTIVARRGPARSSAGATSRPTRSMLGATARVGDADVPAGVRRQGRPRRASSSSATAYVVRKRVRARGRQRVLPVAVARGSSSTRACSRTPQLEEFYPDLQRRARRESRSRSCTRASPPTRSRPGRSRTRTATRAQRRDQHACRATRTGCAPARRCSQSDLLPGDLDRDLPDLHARRVRHRRASTRRSSSSHLGGPPAAARGAHDDPGGVGEPRVDGRASEGVLPLPRVAHGAVGRPRVDRVHRRHGDRRGARPQRPAPVAVLGHRRRPRDHGERGRRARRRRRRRS